jgi:hypothetical protein
MTIICKEKINIYNYNLCSYIFIENQKNERVLFCLLELLLLLLIVLADDVDVDKDDVVLIPFAMYLIDVSSNLRIFLVIMMSRKFNQNLSCEYLALLLN